MWKWNMTCNKYLLWLLCTTRLSPRIWLLACLDKKNYILLRIFHCNGNEYGRAGRQSCMLDLRKDRKAPSIHNLGENLKFILMQKMSADDEMETKLKSSSTYYSTFLIVSFSTQKNSIQKICNHDFLSSRSFFSSRHRNSGSAIQCNVSLAPIFLFLAVLLKYELLFKVYTINKFFKKSISLHLSNYYIFHRTDCIHI